MRPAALADSVTPGSDAAATLAEILLAAPPKLDTLVAHSKGSLIVAHALQRYIDDLEGDDSPLFKRLHIVTLGAVVGVPAEFKHVKQYLGAYDWFGGANSSLGVKHERVPGVSHHLNPGFPYHMRVAPLLNGGAGGHAPRLLPKPALEVTFPPMPIPVEVPKVAKPARVAAAAKVREPVRKPAKKMTNPVAPAPKAAPAPKVAPPAPRLVSSTAKPAAKPVPKKVTAAPREPLKAAKAKTMAANGKLVVKKSRKGVR